MYGAEREEVSESWLHTYDLSSTMIPNASTAMDDEEHFCKLILYKEIKDSRVRIWDIIILVPNLLFLLFIAMRFNRARLKLRATSSPIFLAFYGLVICNVVISVVRCVVSMTVNAAATVGGKADKVLWVTVRFFLLSTEMSVVIFGLAFGHLDSRSSIRRVLLATSFIALAFTITQGTLELVLPDDTFHIPSRDFYVFGHGGMMFWFCSSLVFTTIYLFILILPWTRLRDRLALPTRKSFYVYAGILATLDLVQSIGAGFLNYTQNPVGLCIVDFTAAVYLTLFTPLVYHTFLSEFFGVSQPSIMFSYKAQVDDAMDEDTVSLPHQQSFSSLKTDSDYIYQVHTPSIHIPLYDSYASKSSRPRASLYSLTSAKDPKHNDLSTFDSPVKSYRSTSGIRSFGRDSSIEKDVSEVEYPLTKSTTIQKSVPDLRLSSPIRKAVPDTYDDPSSVSHLFLSTDTASNFFYKPNTIDSNINLFSQTRKSSLESISPKTIIDHVTAVENLSYGYDSFSEIQISQGPALENTLQSILESGTHEIETEVPKKSRLKTTDTDNLVKDGTASAGSRCLTTRISSEMFKPSDDMSPNLSDSNVTQQLLPRATSFTTGAHRKSKNDSKEREPGGLSDYLLSITSPKFVKHKRSEAHPNPSADSDFYTQTESL
ncbi:transmembrane protein adipocyte-associated 1 homolog [Mycetomoellerius zeteki]|uniref:transmembrane protein adipocyte-associated 1 homolog n=1 Tax=Mycetomoellerius zeteki TaxID=64791 RepID=UPI00084E7F78|nr:PREDICTED: transmembrane protein adipocyte-associated 1 homolog [Trachymyrmex zeteki]XP_018308830.1 PREDICTED: transmembrane protein adipocyte-associated 1 homolog [Trachymyrmex zeteki]XP_018308831.1 PREDICTED: transmembrane protein adipocyte-associated 1 homolog [Trachymyrmex zeteki]XP_018308832.1 PREDICTED: transmembrane protein adipocyte-associated 1 homolog [Trachymyrmex zeteki]